MMNLSIEAARFERREVTNDEAVPRFRRPNALSFPAAGGSFLMSGYRSFTEKREKGAFAGILSTSILAAGIVLLFLFVDNQVTIESIDLSY